MQNLINRQTKRRVALCVTSMGVVEQCCRLMIEMTPLQLDANSCVLPAVMLLGLVDVCSGLHEHARLVNHCLT